MILRFIAAVLEGRTPRVYGDGGQSRDFLISNVVDVNLLAAMAPEAAGQIFKQSETSEPIH